MIPWYFNCNSITISENVQRSLSVVVAVRSGPAAVLRLLQSLRNMRGAAGVEIIAANCLGQTTAEEIALHFPDVRVVNLPADIPIAEARNAAIQQASGELIAVLHERYAVAGDWAERVIETHRSVDAEAIAGVVEPAEALTGAEWAMFLTEYAHLATARAGPLERADAVMIPGGNASYKREAFRKASMAGRLWELDFHAALYDEGARFYRADRIVAAWVSPYGVREYCKERAAVSRDLAARRAVGKPVPVRMAAAASRVLLPAVVFARVGRAACGSRRYAGRFLAALPWIALFSCVQAWGEIRGYFDAAQQPPHQLAR